MPTYEYVCTSCGNQWEEIQKISEAALTDCPKCQNASAKRQISGGSFILKGGGWYADLYSSSGGKKPAAEASKSETKSETKTESAPSTDTSSKTEAKPAAAPATPATPAKTS
jgi:putative FmdB family regulatory protein